MSTNQNNRQLYIGINGLAGSGKDTVAKMLKTILSYNWDNLEKCKNFYKSVYTNPTRSATYNPSSFKETNNSEKVLCIAYADQLKNICSTIFGIPLERFYMNKANAWICITDEFQYTETKPDESDILTAQEYYEGVHYTDENQKNHYWMSLREILVYVGTYVLQDKINPSIFVNIVNNKIRELTQHNNNLSYIIVTDLRFSHEIDYVRKNNGITIKVVRDSVQQLDNIAEHLLDNEMGYDYIIENNEGYDELFEKIWDIVHSDIEFSNKTINLCTRDNSNNYLRLIDEDEDYATYVLCTPYNIQNIYHNDDGDIAIINPTGGPVICIGEPIDSIDAEYYTEKMVPKQIMFHEDTSKFIIVIDKNFYKNLPHIY